MDARAVLKYKIGIRTFLFISAFCLCFWLAGVLSLNGGLASAASPPPEIFSVTPNPVPGTNGLQPLVLTGTNFLAGGRVLLRDLNTGQAFVQPVPASVSSTNIVINANFTAAVHTWSVEVINPDGQTSGAFPFSVGVPPRISGVSPNPVPATNAVQPLVVRGTNFVPGARVILRDLNTGRQFDAPTPFSTATNTLTVFGNFTTARHTWTIEVINPNGQSSGAFLFEVGVSPQITAVTPNPVPATNASQTLTLIGSNFVAGARIILRDLNTGQIFANRAPTSASSTNISISANFTAAVHGWSVEVINPDGQSSGAFPFSVGIPPRITTVSPNPVPATYAVQSVGILGSNFVAGARVILRDLNTGQIFANRVPVSLSSSNITISANFTAALHTWSVEVINPDGESSGPFSFTVGVPPQISSVSPNPVPGTNALQTLVVAGSNFVAGARVVLRDLANGQSFARPSISSLYGTNIALVANFTAAVHAWSVEVINPNGQSSGQFIFTVGVPPSITGVSPNPVPPTNAVQVFVINGSNFVSGASVVLRDLITGQAFFQPPLVSRTSTNITLNANFGIAQHPWTVEVINPNGQSSGQFAFTLGTHPIITGVSPNPVPATNGTQAITVNGFGFLGGASVILRTGRSTYSNLTVSIFGETAITLSRNFTTNAATWTVEVINVNGASSGQFTFSVASTATGTNGTPQISRISPDPVPRLNGVQPLKIFGSNFVAGDNIVLRDLTAGQVFAHQTNSFLSNTQMTINVDFTAAFDSWSIEVISPTGQSSGQFVFTVGVPSTGVPLRPALGLTAGRPSLAARREREDMVFSWPVAGAGFILESTTNLAGTNWSPVRPQPELINGEFRLTNRVEAGRMFYRLRNR